MSENLLFTLPFEILEIITTFLSIQDILNLSLTSKFSNEIIGNSRCCMNRIWIKFYTFKLKDLKCLEESERNYEKLKINRVKENAHFEFLHRLHMPWSKMLIYNCEIKQFPQFASILKNCSDTIEELELSDIQILNNNYAILPINFPRLQRAMFRNVPSTAMEIFLGENTRLKNLSFDIAREICDRRSISDLINTILRNSNGLKHLQLGPHYIKSLFDSENTTMNFEFKLEKLMLKFPIIPHKSEQMENNISQLLSNQTKLDWVIFWELHSDEILSVIWNKNESLTHISFFGLEDLFESMDLLLEVNKNVRQIDLLSRKVLLSQLRIILNAAPNLRKLHVSRLTKHVMECAAKTHMNLQEIKYETIDEEIEELYENLKKSGEDAINSRLILRQVSFWASDCAGPFLVDPKFWH